MSLPLDLDGNGGPDLLAGEVRLQRVLAVGGDGQRELPFQTGVRDGCDVGLADHHMRKLGAASSRISKLPASGTDQSR